MIILLVLLCIEIRVRYSTRYMHGQKTIVNANICLYGGKIGSTCEQLL